MPFFYVEPGKQQGPIISFRNEKAIGRAAQPGYRQPRIPTPQHGAGRNRVI